MHESIGPEPRQDDLVLYVYGELPAERQRFLASHLQDCGSCQAAVAELARARDVALELARHDMPETRWRAMLARVTETGQRRRWSVGPVAAAAAIALAVLSAFVGWASRGAELERLRAELRDAHATVVVGLMREPRSTDRLRAISLGGELVAIDQRVAVAFARALRNDPSPNVRLAALDALGAGAPRDQLMSELVGGLSADQSPGIRLAMIELLVRVGDERAGEALATVASHDPDPTVRARAIRAAAELRRAGRRGL